jgi:hypothetical protein
MSIVTQPAREEKQKTEILWFIPGEFLRLTSDEKCVRPPGVRTWGPDGTGRRVHWSFVDSRTLESLARGACRAPGQTSLIERRRTAGQYRDCSMHARRLQWRRVVGSMMGSWVDERIHELRFTGLSLCRGDLVSNLAGSACAAGGPTGAVPRPRTWIPDGEPNRTRGGS